MRKPSQRTSFISQLLFLLIVSPLYGAAPVSSPQVSFPDPENYKEGDPWPCMNQKTYALITCPSLDAKGHFPEGIKLADMCYPVSAGGIVQEVPCPRNPNGTIKKGYTKPESHLEKAWSFIQENPEEVLALVAAGVSAVTLAAKVAQGIKAGQKPSKEMLQGVIQTVRTETSQGGTRSAKTVRVFGALNQKLDHEQIHPSPPTLGQKSAERLSEEPEKKSKTTSHHLRRKNHARSNPSYLRRSYGRSPARRVHARAPRHR